MEVSLHGSASALLFEAGIGALTLTSPENVMTSVILPGGPPCLNSTMRVSPSACSSTTSHRSNMGT